MSDKNETARIVSMTHTSPRTATITVFREDGTNQVYTGVHALQAMGGYLTIANHEGIYTHTTSSFNHFTCYPEESLCPTQKC